MTMRTRKATRRTLKRKPTSTETSLLQTNTATDTMTLPPKRQDTGLRLQAT